MKILFLTPIFPYPPFSGGQTRAYNLVKNLAGKNRITLFSFIRPGRIQGPTREMEKFCWKIKTFPGRPIWSMRNIFLAARTKLPFTITHFYGDSQVKLALEKEIKKEKYDLVHFESFYTSCYLDSVCMLPKVLGNENIEYLIYQRYLSQKNLLVKSALSYEVWKMKRYEQKNWQKADLNLAVSDSDAEIIRKESSKECVVIPNGVDIAHFQKKTKNKSLTVDSPLLLFVGDFKYFANQDAISFLVKKIWPEVKKELPQAKLWLVGKNSDRLAEIPKDSDIIVDDQIDDIREAYNKADLLVAPMRIGSGTNIKILEALSVGLPVATTPVGLEGIKAEKGKEIVVAHKSEEFARKIAELLSNKKRYQKISRAGRRLVEKDYDWSKITFKLEKAYKTLLSK